MGIESKSHYGNIPGIAVPNANNSTNINNATTRTTTSTSSVESKTESKHSNNPTNRIISNTTTATTTSTIASSLKRKAELGSQEPNTNIDSNLSGDIDPPPAKRARQYLVYKSEKKEKSEDIDEEKEKKENPKKIQEKIKEAFDGLKRAQNNRNLGFVIDRVDKLESLIKKYKELVDPDIGNSGKIDKLINEAEALIKFVRSTRIKSEKKDEESEMEDETKEAASHSTNKQGNGIPGV